MASEPTLLVIQMEAVHRSGSTLLRARKSLDGLRRFAADWPGRVVVASHVLPGPPPHPAGWVADDGTEIEHIESDDPVDAARRVDPDVILGLHHPRQYGLLDAFASRTVLMLENSWAQRTRIAMINQAGAGRARILAGALRRRTTFRRAIAQAAGVQCNGYAAWAAARPLNERSMVFFDHRITQEIVAESAPVHPAPAPGVLRLGFSGRHTRIKGPDHAVRLARRLREAGTDVELTMFGEGDMTPALQREAGPGVRFAGMIGFEDGWVPEVRSSVDVMVLPSPQGDPAGTYLESAGLRVPVLGYANSALAPLVERHSIGWCVPVGDERALFEKARELATHREEIAAMGRTALDFVREHTFEREYELRARHLVEIAGRV